MCVVERNSKEVLAGIGRDNVKGEDFGRIIGGKLNLEKPQSRLFGGISRRVGHRS